MRKTTFIVAVAVAAAVALPALAQPPAGGGGRGPQQTPEARAAAFKTADTNADGKLSKDEFTASLPEARRANADMAFGRRDANTDGAITLEEFTAPGGRGGGRPGA